MALSLASCHGSAPPEQVAGGPSTGPRPVVTRPAGWAEQKLESGFFMALPAGYAIKVTNGPDFAVYYFAPTDTAAHKEFAGGVYFGNAPQDSQLDTAGGCTVRRQAVWLLRQPATLAVQHCPGGYAVRALVKSPSVVYEGEQLAIFGQAGTAGELGQLQAALATLRYQAPPNGTN